ncbi:hypothetical protein KJ764_05050, partial [Patescibacteria group bacterium]|nr:hypothetical protein [Patescibacteria group bacterium]
PAPASTEGVLEGLGEMPQFDGQGENAVPKRAEDQPEPQPAPEPAAPAQPLASEVPDEVPPDGGPSVTPEGSQIPEEDPEKRVDSFLDEDFSLIIKIDPTTGLADRRLFFKAQALLLLQLRVEGYRRIGLPDDRIVRDIDREVEAIEELHGNGGAK